MDDFALRAEVAVTDNLKKRDVREAWPEFSESWHPLQGVAKTFMCGAKGQGATSKKTF